MRYILAAVMVVWWCLDAAAQSEINKRVILIGNAHEAVRDNEEFLSLVKRQVVFDSNTIVLYLGNNVGARFDADVLTREAAIINNTEAKAYFIPGYNDWAGGGAGGYKAILEQQRVLEGLNNKNIKIYPGNGCPGPRRIDLGNDALMLIMDSQWWLHNGVKPDIESDCKFRTKEEVLMEVEDIPKDNMDKLILVVTHHPFENTGVHSGTFGLKQHIFPFTDARGLDWLYLPLPVAGSFYPIASNAISSNQDMHNREYQSLAYTGIRTIPGLKKAFEDHPNTIFIAGQEHNMQLLEKDGHHFIISGASGKAGRVRDNKDAEYVRQHTGFAVLEIYRDKKVKSRFYLISNGNVKEDYVADILDYSTRPTLAEDTTTIPMMSADSVVAKASEEMARSSFFKRLLIGKNYRREWGAPVKMKVLHITQEKGGMRITGLGGGHESKSLQLEDGSGRKWVFRSVNKQLDAVIPEGFQETIASEYIHDMLSASNPYGALAVPALQSPLHIVQARPELFYVPNDPALKQYRPLFANGVGLLEERKPAVNVLGSVNTNVALNNMVKHSDHFADQKAYLNIRLIDFLIADFDRHQGQYSWGKIDSMNRTFYYPIPKDRDQTFYHNTGLIMDVMRHADYKFMINFPYRIKKMENAGIVGAYLDLLFLNKLSEEDWRAAISTFRERLTDSVIDAAVNDMPPEIRAIRGNEIGAKLKSRRNGIAEDGMDYYRFISKRVDILGGNKNDVFKVTGSASGLTVQVYTREDNGVEGLKYSRTFDPAVTREVRLFGFNGDDYFNIEESAKSRIRLKIVGGLGDDTFSVRGRVRNHIYDLKSEDNAIINRRRTTKMFSSNPLVNEFRLRETIHNMVSLPGISLSVNKDDGFVAGFGLSYRTYGFRKYPYASKQSIAAAFAFGSGAYMIKYRGEFIDVFRHYDLLLNAELYNPVLSNFYGFGNETKKDDAKSVKFYRTRYNYTSDEILVRKRFHKDNIMSISAGPSIYYYWLEAEHNKAKILEQPSTVGLDSMSVYSKKFYAGGKIAFTINTLNNELLPIRGIYWNTTFTGLQSLNDNSKSYTKLQSNLDVYAVLDEPNRVLASLHFGGGHIFSDHFEYFQALTLGGNNYLRGYRVNRFAGSSVAYGSAELKVKLFDFNAYILKGDLGLVGFNDLGRVWMRGEQSQKWHYGYGGGVYLIPFNSVMISAVIGCSEEDQLFNFSVGTKINMVFQGL